MNTEYTDDCHPVRLRRTAFRKELYDCEKDPEENFSLGSSSPEQLHQAREMVQDNEKAAARLRAYYRISGPVKEDIDEQTEETMRGLGYLH